MTVNYKRAGKVFSYATALFLALLTAGMVSAWTAPSQAPTGGNVAAPINVGSVSQIKTGGIWAASVGSDSGYCIGSSCITSWPAGGSGFTGSGVANYLAKFTGATAVGSSQIYDNGTYVGIGNAAPAYKLHVSGDIYANGGWLRSSGSAGWYNESFGGGWFMQDSTWIRAYNNKNVWVDQIIGSNGGLNVGYSGGGSTPAGGAIIAGNVGIGTVSPGAKLTVGASAGGANQSFYDIGAGKIAAGTSIYSYGTICSGNSSGDCSGTGGVVISPASIKFPDGSTQTTAAGTGVWTSSGTNIYNNNSGNVGIGTANPGAKLDVQGGNLRIGDMTLIPQSNGWLYQGNSAGTIYGGSGIAANNFYANADVFVGAAGGWASSVFCRSNGTNCPAGSAPTWASITGKPFNWSGQGGQPTWLWGSNDGTNYYVWNPSNFSVSYANTSGTANNSNALGGLGSGSFLKWNTWDSGNYYQTDGNIYMAWAGNWLSTVLNSKLSSLPGNNALWDTWYGTSYLGSNGDLYMGWNGGRWLSSIINQDVRTNAQPQFARIYDDDANYYVDSNTWSRMNAIDLNQLNVGIMYDRDNTGYYVDPNGTTNVNNLCLNGSCRSSWPSVSLGAIVYYVGYGTAWCPDGWVMVGQFNWPGDPWSGAHCRPLNIN